MKKALFILVILIATSGIKAQSYYHSYDHHDLLVSYGLFLPDQFKNVNSKMLDDLFPQQLYVRDNYQSYGALFFTYHYIFKNNVTVLGFSFGLSNSTSKIYNVGQYEGELSRKFYTGAIDWAYRYYNRGPIQLYSGLGLGFTFGKETFTPNEVVQSSTGNKSSIAYQINAFGIRIGKKFGGFIEFGYGYKGIVNLGFSAQLF